VAAFFRTQPFARIGATVNVATRMIGDLGPVNAIAGVLKNRIVDIARWTRFSEVNAIFEASERADRHIEAAFQDFRLEEGGAAIPVECYFMPKAAHGPALEVADFIMHAIGRQTRRRIEGCEGFAPDFAQVKCVRRRGARWPSEYRRATCNATGSPSRSSAGTLSRD
jgi:hypothetical protein